jgi:methionyl-tRNA formyltransferase
VPGTILAVDANGVVVAAGEGSVRMLELQRPGAKRLPVREFLAGGKIDVGAVFTG